MSKEYKLSFTAEEIDERLDKAGNAVLFVPQELTEAKKVQAKENIGASNFYHDLGQCGVMQFEGNAEYEWTAYCLND